MMIRALSPAVRIAAAATAVVALGSAVLSWDALRWGAGQLGVDPALTWLFPIVVDGTIVVGTVAAITLRKARLRIRAYVWAQLGAAIGASVVGNAAHAAGGNWVHQVGSAVPAVALAASLHLLVIIVRGAGQAEPVGARAQPAAPRPPRSAPRPRGRHRGPRAPRRVDTIRALVAEAAEQGRELTEDQVARQFHLARDAAAVLLRAAHAPPAQAA